VDLAAIEASAWYEVHRPNVLLGQLNFVLPRGVIANMEKMALVHCPSRLMVSVVVTIPKAHAAMVCR